MSAGAVAGGCLCGAVRFTVAAPLRPVVNCHCGMCRRFHGHVAAYTDAPRAALSFAARDGLASYESSPGILRSFCRTCGSSLFWERVGQDKVAIAAGTLDAPTGLATVRHIFMADAGDYYTVTDGLEQLPGTMAKPAPG
ncbi:GFA family protein [Zavarzinia sp. CC-PAN008]|uniref:GFA family protein n=1 Tax=Zavarzinia sp. CC-PAN008 TaxID=3243332 RepID=UPI003F747B58